MKWLSRLLRLIAVLLGTGLLAAIALGIAVVGYLAPQLPSIAELKDVRLQQPLRIFSADGKLIAEFGEKRRIPLNYQEIPERAVQAFLAAEDDRFFEHPGVDYQGLLRAAAGFALTGEKRQGGSTITMQVARNFFLTPEKTFSRKINEILLALRIEQNLSKEEILELYLNKIYMGNRAYGLGAAAQVYYGKTVAELDLAQTAMLAGLPKAPSRINPLADPERATQRRNYVLTRMLELGFIDPPEATAASRAPITAKAHSTPIEAEAPYVAEAVRSELMERFGADIYTAGIHVYTTVDSELQRLAYRALRENLDAYDRRHGYRGPANRTIAQENRNQPPKAGVLDDLPRIGELRPALITAVGDKSAEASISPTETVRIEWAGLSWARRYINENSLGPSPKKARDITSPGDLVYVKSTLDQEGRANWELAQPPAAESAMVSLDPKTGWILAMVGGYDFYRSKFNRAIQAQRQPGSAFKPFIYSAALEAGYTPASIVNDAPIVLEDPSVPGGYWRPENYSREFYGPTRLRYALAKSRNLVSIRLLQGMGIDHAVKHIAAFGFGKEAVPRALSVALGSGVVTPMEMARGYAVFANQGHLIDPVLIDRVTDDEGRLVYSPPRKAACRDCGEMREGSADIAPAPEAISARNAYLITSMLQDVIAYGTATKARVLGRKDLAGKTGTTNDQHDAWFCGYSPSLVTVVWVGLDSSGPLGRKETGGRAALPAWISFMKAALQGQEDRVPEPPPGIVTVRIDPDSGLLATEGQPNAIFESFFSSTVPRRQAEQAALPWENETGSGLGRRVQVADPF